MKKLSYALFVCALFAFAGRLQPAIRPSPFPRSWGRLQPATALHTFPRAWWGRLQPAILAQDVPVFKSDVRLVEIYATVFDHGGHPVDGLHREQFEVRDDGAAQPIQVFESSETPLSCALLLDTTGSMTDSIPALRNAAREFIGQLRPKDTVAVYAFTDHVDELAEFTEDKAVARRGLARLRAGGRTALFDAISQVALSLERRPGKKVIVVLTDGGDNASTLNRESAANRARKAGVPVFAVAEGQALKDPAAAKLLHELAEATGGHLYKAERDKDIEKVFSAIADDLQSGYLLAFHPPTDEKPTPWHELRVSVKDTPKPLSVRARTGYPGD
jgi:Ca-activated chloride channel family protein